MKTTAPCKSILCFVALLVVVAVMKVPAAGAAECTGEPAAPGQDAGIHAPFDGMLRAFVRDGVVDYGCFQAHEEQLDHYLALLARIQPSQLSKESRLALWINAYNAFTIKLILRRYPDIESIKEIPGRWKIEDWTVGGRRYSLDQIEHQILRKEFSEPRIHFAIVCASISCPDLAAESYVPGRLDSQLDRAVRRFVSDREKGFDLRQEKSLLSGSKQVAYLSSIFKWFHGDFERDGRTLLDFIFPYLPANRRIQVERHRGSLSIDFMDYDWNLNGK